VSALWAVPWPHRRPHIEAAHRGAIASAMARVERDVELVQRRERGVAVGAGPESGAGGVRAYVVAAHAGQEMHGVPDPQLHSHVVVVAARDAWAQLRAGDSVRALANGRAVPADDGPRSWTKR